MCNQTLRTDDCIEKVINQYANMVYQLAFARTRNKSDAEDVFQNVFLKYIRKNPNFNEEEHRKAWLIRVTINCSKTLLLSSWYKKTEPLEDVFVIEDKESVDLYQELNQLPSKYREVIHLFYYEDLSIAEISKILGRKESTTRTQLTRARAIMKNFMKEDDYV